MYHKPQATPWYNCPAIARRALFGHGLFTRLSDFGAALPHKRERSRALQLGKTLSQLPLRVTQLSRCYIPVLKPSRMLSSSLIKLSYHPACCLIGVERLLFSLRCWVPGSDSVAATPPGKIALLTLSLKRSNGH